MVRISDYVDLPEVQPDDPLADIRYFQRKMVEALCVPAHTLLGLTKEEWILRRLVVSDADIEAEIARRAVTHFRLDTFPPRA